MNNRSIFSSAVDRVTALAVNLVTRIRLTAPIAVVGMMIAVNAYGQIPADISTDVPATQNPAPFKLTPASDAAAACVPDATATVQIISSEEIRGVDTLILKASGLPARTDFAVFLTELPVAPFGAVQYIGDFTTNQAGRGFVKVDTIVDEAFSSTVVDGQRVRKDLNHIVIWFADPTQDDFCGGPASQAKTPFDGDGEAGFAVLSSKDFLPGAPLP
jgi:hypothetical protein